MTRWQAGLSQIRNARVTVCSRLSLREIVVWLDREATFFILFGEVEVSCIQRYSLHRSLLTVLSAYIFSGRQADPCCAKSGTWYLCIGKAYFYSHAYGIKLPSMTMRSNSRVQLNGFVYFLVKARGLIGGINIETINAPNPWTMVFGGTK